MAADAEVRMGLQRLARGVDQMPSPRNHMASTQAHTSQTRTIGSTVNSYSQGGAFVAIASKTRSDDERLIWRFLDLLGGLSVLSVAQEFSCSYPLFVVRER